MKNSVSLDFFLHILIFYFQECFSIVCKCSCFRIPVTCLPESSFCFVSFCLEVFSCSLHCLRLLFSSPLCLSLWGFRMCVSIRECGSEKLSACSAYGNGRGLLANGLPCRAGLQELGLFVGWSPDVSVAGLFSWAELLNSSAGGSGGMGLTVSVLVPGEQGSLHEILFLTLVWLHPQLSPVTPSRALLSGSFSTESRPVSGRPGEVLFVGRLTGKELGPAGLFCRLQPHLPIRSRVLTREWCLQLLSLPRFWGPVRITSVGFLCWCLVSAHITLLSLFPFGQLLSSFVWSALLLIVLGRTGRNASVWFVVFDQRLS